MFDLFIHLFYIKHNNDIYFPGKIKGEEISITVRGFTFGYDFYAHLNSVVFHEYFIFF